MSTSLTPWFRIIFDSFGSIRHSFGIGEAESGAIIFTTGDGSGAWLELVDGGTCEDRRKAEWLSEHKISFSEAMAIFYA